MASYTSPEMAEKDMKTIVSVTPVAVTSDSRTFKMAASFTRFGFRSIVVEGAKSEFQPNDLPFELFEVRGGVVFSTSRDFFDASASQGRSSIKKVKYWLTRLAKPFLNQIRTFISLPNASLYYLHSFYQFPAVFLKSRLLGVKYIYDAHDYYQDENPGMLNKWVETLCIKFAAAVVTVSGGVARLLKGKFNCTPIVIRNCHDSRLEEEPAQNLRQYLGLSGKEFLIVVVGQAKDGMAVEEALEALASVPSHVHLAFVGKNTHNFSALVEQSPRPENIHLVPPVLPGQVVPFIRSADVALILYYPRTDNYKSCLPNGFFQSISAELPLLYPDLPEISRLASKYQLGISINTQSANDIANGILQFVRGKGVQYKDNLAKASSELSWEREEQILRNLVEGLLFHSSRKQE